MGDAHAQLMIVNQSTIGASMRILPNESKRRQVVFVTGRGGAGFHSPGPALTRGRGGIFRVIPARGPPALISWTGPRLLPPIFSEDPSGVWVGQGPQRGQGQGMPKKTPRPRPLSGVGRGTGPGARVFRGPACPVTNSIPKGNRYFFVSLVVFV